MCTVGRTVKASIGKCNHRQPVTAARARGRQQVTRAPSEATPAEGEVLRQRGPNVAKVNCFDELHQRTRLKEMQTECNFYSR